MNKMLNASRERLVLYGTIILLSMTAVVITTVVLSTSAPTETNYGGIFDQSIFVLGISAGFILEMFIPFIIERIFKIRISTSISLIFIIHCFGGTFLGNVANAYHDIPYFDNIMHFLVGVNFCMVGYALMQLCFGDQGVDNHPLIIALVSVCIGVACGTIWEVYEFMGDVLADLNMQGYMLKTGEYLTGQAALMDTMMDTLFNIAGAVAFAIPLCLSIKLGKPWHHYCCIIKLNLSQNHVYKEISL